MILIKLCFGGAFFVRVIHRYIGYLHTYTY